MATPESITVNPYSLTSYYVEPFFNDISLSKATCFFSTQHDKIYLITNWHVVSGKDADTFNLLDSKYASIPNKLRIYLPKQDDKGQISFEDDGYIEIELYAEDGSPVWYELKKDERMIDIAVIPFNLKTDRFFMPIEMAEEPFNETTKIEIASELYIIGFPFGRIGGYTPIWKKASVASEPEIDIENMPYFFADTATREGMSGSPVIFYKERQVTMMSEKENLFSRHRTKFVGVYSGRIGANSEKKGDAQLGRIWKESIIKQIIESNEHT